MSRRAKLFSASASAVVWGAIASAAAPSALAASESAESSSTGIDLDQLQGTAPVYGRFPDDAIVTTGDFDGSLRIPGTGVSVRLGGFVRADIIHDIDSLGFPDVVSHVTIPLDDSPAAGRSQTRLSARNSRINFDVRGHSALGEVRAFIEADFLGGGSALTSGYTFQLRHAAAQWGHLYVGQWWSTFVDVATLPEGADAPLGAPTLRQPGIRWGQNISDSWRFVVAAESPAGDVSNAPEALAFESVPDFVGYLQFRRRYLKLRASGVLRRLEAGDEYAWVGGTSVSGRLELPFLGAHDNLSFQGQYGSALSRYYLPLAGAGLDAVVDGAGIIRPIVVRAGFVALQHWWSDRWRSTVVASVLDLVLPDAASENTLDNGQYYAANLYWSPVDRVTIGIDCVFARREIASNAEGSGLRIHASARIDL